MKPQALPVSNQDREDSMSADKRSGEERRQLESYARLRNIMGKLAGRKPDLGAAFDRLADELAKTERESGTLQVVVIGDGGRRSWVLELTTGRCEARESTADAPRFEMIAKASAVHAMLSGEVAPIAAMAKGDMRVRGDLEFGKRIYKLLAADEGRIDPCK